MNTRKHLRRHLLSALALTIAGTTLSRPAAAADEAIVASLSQTQLGLFCGDAAARTSVYFQFAHPTFAVSQISLYLDGRGVPKEAIDQHWPTVTLSQGLHAGRNTVDIVAEGRGGQRLSRRLVVLVGPSAGGDATAPATVPCDDSAAAGDIDADSLEAIEEPPPIVYQQPTVIVESAPVYVYRPYPAVALDAFVPLVPFFGFSFFYSNYHPYCPPPRVVYQTSPDYRWRGGGRDRGHDVERWRGHDHSWHDHDGRGDRRVGADGPQGPDNWHGRNIPNAEAPRGTPYHPAAPAPGWHRPQPARPNRNGDLQAGDRAMPPGQSNPSHNNPPPQRELQPHRGGGFVPPQPGAPPPGPRGGRQGGDHGGERGGERGGEHRHDNH